MRVVFVQTYPVYHDLLGTEQWLRLENRDRWMPGVLAGMGHEVELWAVDHTAGVHESRLEGFGSYTIRLFPPTRTGRKTKFHGSDLLVDQARRSAPDLFILKGVDGGVGIRLIERYLEPEHRPYVFVIGGAYYNRYVPRAEIVFYETERQRQALERPGKRLWRRAVPPENLIRLPKSIDTENFRPLEAVAKEWDVLSVGRLIPHYKRYDALGALADAGLRVAVVGKGPMEAELRGRYPSVAWLGATPNRELPALFNRARTFMHPGLRDYYPRVIAEAGACGLPCIGFAEAIDEDVIPPDVGLRVERSGYVEPIRALLADEARLQAMSRRAREQAVRGSGKQSTRAPLTEMLKRLGARANTVGRLQTAEAP